MRGDPGGQGGDKFGITIETPTKENTVDHETPRRKRRMRHRMRHAPSDSGPVMSATPEKEQRY